MNMRYLGQSNTVEAIGFCFYSWQCMRDKLYVGGRATGGPCLLQRLQGPARTSANSCSLELCPSNKETP